MKKMQYSEIKGDSKGFYALLTLSVLLLSSALSAAWFMEHNGHYVTGMNNQIVWGLPHVFAIFLILGASGALNVASIGSVFGRIVYKPLRRLSGLLAIALLVGGLAVLILDLGRPDRLIVAMTTYNFKSIFAWNIYFYTGFLGVVAVYLWVQMDHRIHHLIPTVGLIAFIWRICLTTATGSIFGFIVAREGYDSAIMPPMFITMSFSFGLAFYCIVLMASIYCTKRELGDVVFNRLGRLLGIFAAAVLYFTAIQHLANLYAAEHSGYEDFILTSGSIYTWLFWVVQVFMGGVLPLLLTLMPASPIPHKNVFWAAALIIIGGFAQVYIIVIAGQAWPLNLFPGKEVSSSVGDGAIASYIPTAPEVLLGFGGLGIAGLIVLFGLKLLKFLPNSLADAEVDPNHQVTAD